MIRERFIGDIRVVTVTDYYGPTHPPETTFPEFNASAMARQETRLPPGFWYPEIRRFVIAINIWIVFAGARIILIDAGVGNRKPRPAERANMLNTLVPHWLLAAGVTRENVTDVVMTHLHADHIGWNTVLEDGRWVPNFPNARYHIPKVDLAFFKGRHDRGEAPDQSIADSLIPILDAGLADLVDRQNEVLGLFRVTEAFGHTPGMLTYWLTSQGETGVFSADIFHSPIQILQPDWNTAFCILPDAARATRHCFLAKVADAGTLVMPCHFAAPHCGYVRREGDGYAFEPAA